MFSIILVNKFNFFDLDIVFFPIHFLFSYNSYNVFKHIFFFEKNNHSDYVPTQFSTSIWRELINNI